MCEGSPSFVEVRVTLDELTKSAEEGSLKCKECSRCFNNLNALRMHLVKTHNLVRTPSDCRLRTRRRSPNSDVERRFFCPFEDCRYSGMQHYFRSFKLLRQHFSKVHSEKSLRCDKCKMATFSLQRDLTYHQKRHCPCSLESPPVAKEKAVKVTSVDPSKKSAKKKKFCAPPQSKETHGRKRKRDESTKIIILHMHAACSTSAMSFVPISKKSTFLESKKLEAKQRDVTSVASQTEETGERNAPSSPPAQCHVSSQASLPSIDSIAFRPPVLYEQSDFYCQTALSSGVEFGTQMFPPEGSLYPSYEGEPASSRPSLVAPLNCACSSEARQTEVHDDALDLDDFLRHIETQTGECFASDARTQTAIDLMDSGSMTDWNGLQ